MRWQQNIFETLFKGLKRTKERQQKSSKCNEAHEIIAEGIYQSTQNYHKEKCVLRNGVSLMPCVVGGP